MRNLLTILFILISFMGNAQQLYKANAIRFKEGDKLEQWEKCNHKVYIDEKLNIRIYRSKDVRDLKSQKGISRTCKKISPRYEPRR